MHSRRLFMIFLRPSLFSTVATLSLETAVFGIASWIFISRNPAFYDYLYGPNGIAGNLDGLGGNWGLQFSELLSQSWVYNILILTGSLIIGLAVYAALQALTRIMLTVSETVEELQSGNEQTRQSLKAEITRRAILRTMVGIAGFVFFVAALTLILPLCLALFKAGLAHLPSLEGWPQMLSAAAVFFLTAHIAVLFMRLFLLKPRVFGGQLVIVDALS